MDQRQIPPVIDPGICIPENTRERSQKWRLADWNEVATVRSEPRRRLSRDAEGLPFSPEMVPLISHELVRNRDDAVRRMILGQKLHSYFRFTTHLELKAVLPACTAIGLKESTINTTDEFALDGLKIATDEAHHAYCAEDMKQQLTSITGIGPYRERTPHFSQALARRQASLSDKKDGHLALLSFACVSETLITTSLASLPADERVLKGIRDVVMDHARDESKHHSYFSYFLETMWSQLSPGERDLIGPLFPEFIEMFLARDEKAELDWLEAAGFSEPERKRIIAESREATDLRKLNRRAAKPTLLIMKKIGALDHPATADALAAAGLLE